MIEELKQVRDELLFMADGCLVPPDGGSPDVYDYMASAQRALIAFDRLIAEGGHIADVGKMVVPDDIKIQEMRILIRRLAARLPKEDAVRLKAMDYLSRTFPFKAADVLREEEIEQIGIPVQSNAAPTAQPEKVDVEAIKRKAMDKCLFDTNANIGFSDRNIWDTHQIYEGASRMFDHLAATGRLKV